MAAILGGDGPKWIAGACQHCEEKFREEQAKIEEDEKREKNEEVGYCHFTNVRHCQKKWHS